MFQPIVERSYLFEVNMAAIAAGQIYNLTVAPQILLDAYVYGFRTYTSSQVAKSPNAANVVSTAGAANVLITLQALESSEQFIYLSAYLDYNPSYNAGAVRIFQPRKINWSKSYVQIMDTTGLTAGESVILEPIYRLPDIKQR